MKVVRIPDCVCIEDDFLVLRVKRLDGEERWFPKSMLSDQTQVRTAGQKGTLVISAQAAEEAGWADRTLG